MIPTLAVGKDRAMKLGSKILVVDDNEDFRELLKDVLETKGFSIIEAGDGEEALEQYKKTDPAGAIVDLDMPKMNGIELSKELKKINAKFPILMVTAYASWYSPEEILATGIDAFLSKPVTMDKLVKVIEQL